MVIIVPVLLCTLNVLCGVKNSMRENSPLPISPSVQVATKTVVPASVDSVREAV